MTRKNNTTTKSFYQLISELQKNIKAEKNGINKYSGFEYYTLEDINKALKKYLPDGLFIKFKINAIMVFNRPAIEATVVITDGENEIKSNSIVFVEENKKGMSAEQIMGSAMTYAKKYALASLLLLDDGAEDPDNTSGSEKEQNKPAQKEKKQSPATQPQQDLIDKFIELTSKAQTLEEFNNLKKEFIKKYGSRLNPATTQELKKYVQEVVQAFQST